MWRRVSAVIVPTLIAAGIIAYMLYRVWDDLLVALDNVLPSFLVLAVIVCTIAWVLRGWRYQYILTGLHITAGLWFSTGCIFVSQTANLIVPARLGDLVRMFILKHEKATTYSRGLSSLLIERVFDIVMIALLGVVALPAVLNVPDWFITLIIVPIAGGVIFVAVLFGAGRISAENRYVQMLLGILAEVKEASLNLPALAFLSLSSVLIWLVDVVVCWIVALMFQQEIPFMVVVLAIVIGNLVKAVPITPGGVGTYEVSLALTFELAGVAPAIATLIAVIDHLIKNLVTLAGGVIALYFFGDWSVVLLKKAFTKTLDREELQ